jgi:carbonic anhydrase
MPTRPLVSAAATLLALLALCSAAGAQEPVEWSYEGPTGPEHWASLSPAFAPCGEGSRQSPINLREPVLRPAPRIVTDYVRSPVAELNNGETIEVRSDGAQTLRIGGKAFGLVQFHFHAPAEHLVAGDRSPLEIHFVHQAADGERAVLGALVETGRRNRAFGALRRSFPEQAGEETRVERPIALTRLLPASRRAYRYPGSLTTPPCTEGIRWIVLARPVTVSARQLQALEEIVEGNSRPIQPRNGRSLILH